MTFQLPQLHLPAASNFAVTGSYQSDMLHDRHAEAGQSDTAHKSDLAAATAASQSCWMLYTTARCCSHFFLKSFYMIVLCNSHLMLFLP